MKKLFLFTMLALCLSSVVQSQSKTRVVVRTTDFKLFDYGRSATIQTSNAVATVIDSVTVASGEAGMVEVQVIGFNDSTGTAVTGSRILRYAKTSTGTITLGTATVILATATDTELGSATYAVSATSVGNNIQITVTGKDTYKIRWKANIRKIAS